MLSEFFEAIYFYYLTVAQAPGKNKVFLGNKISLSCNKIQIYDSESVDKPPHGVIPYFYK
jgi:hypothetical protein